jgi:hypothetical protein
MNLAAVDSTGGAHVGDHAQKAAVFEQAQSVDSRLAADYGISTALQRGLNVGHDRGLILDEQHGHRLGFEGR